MAESFYEDGLRFECTRCSCCCRMTPGYVLLTESDLRNLMKATGRSWDEFLEEYCRQININGFKRISLIEKSNLDCILWEKDGCTVYTNRPLQCRSFPFWKSKLSSEAEWNRLKKTCPGIGKGRLHSKARIEHWLKIQTRGKFL
ncbi:hypothetical protein ES703_25083 [subsurface metagenome]